MHRRWNRLQQLLGQYSRDFLFFVHVASSGFGVLQTLGWPGTGPACAGPRPRLPLTQTRHM